MDELRVILLLIGAAILAAVYFLSRPRKSGRGRDRERRAAPDPEAGDGEPALRADPDEEPPSETVSRELKRLGELISRDRKRPEPPGNGRQAAGKARAEAPAEDQDASRALDHDRIVVLYLRARGEDRISGPRLIEAARKAGLEYGDMEIFHRLDESGHREPIFSMANMVAPGTLERARSPEFTTPGVALFMRLPGPLKALDGWDAMLATARRLAEILDADMLDEHHSNLNRQRIQQIREDMREYDRRATLEIRKSKS